MTRLAVRDGKEIKKRTKEVMASLINGALQRKQFMFPLDDLKVVGRNPRAVTPGYIAASRKKGH